MSFDFYMFVGGYWSPEDTYLGGESHNCGKQVVDGFSLETVLKLIVEVIGYEENMRNISWFPPETPDKKEGIDDNETLQKVLHYGIGSGAMILYVVRDDDPYIGRRIGDGFRSLSDDEADWVQDDDGSDARGYDSGSDTESGSDEAANLSADESSSDDEVAVKDERNYKRFELGQEYKTIDSFKSALHRYVVKKRRDIKYKKSDRKKVTAICSGGKCPWRIYASVNSTSTRVVIRTFQEEHNCTWQGHISLLTNSRIAEMFIGEFRLNPYFSANMLQEKLMSKNINVPWTICERTRLRCLKTFDNEQAEQFARLFDYVAELKRANDGSTVELEVKGTMFSRFYTCFGALLNGWKSACRRIIHLDGTFLKWRMTGILLVACGRDPNDQMFPIAWGIVDVENKDNWLWFLEHLVKDLGVNQGNGLTLASDQQKGLIAAVKEILPYAEHRMCARHVYANWKKKHSGADLEDLFWAAADSYYPLQFERKMKELKEYDPVAHEDLKISRSCPWSRVFFTEYSKCDSVENNLGESFNAAIRVARTKPIVEMLEEIRQRIMVCNDKKRLEAEKARGVCTPRAVALLDQQIELTKDCRSLSCGLGKYEVTHFNNRFVVHLRNETSCSCRFYLISGIPCCHIASALRLEKNLDQDPKTMINQWFTVDRLRACYGKGLGPVNGMNLWEVTTDTRVTPPPYKSPGGRPPGKHRKKEKGEKKTPTNPNKVPKIGIRMHCGSCGQEGHNKTKCQNVCLPKPPKKPNGRPRIRPIEDSIGWTEHSTNSQALEADAWRPWNEGGAQPSEDLPRLSSAPPPQTRGKKRKAQTETNSSSQPMEDTMSLSKALPKRKPGRPRKNPAETDTSSQPLPDAASLSREPSYDIGPRLIPREGYGLFTSEESGDDYIHLGKSVRDTHDNTVLPSELYRAREVKKAKVARGRGRGIAVGIAAMRL